jgi:fatty acid desaturase
VIIFGYLSLIKPMVMRGTIPEEKYEAYFRRHPFIVPSVSLLVLVLLYCGVAGCHYFFTNGHYYMIIPAAFFAHAYFIISIHDASHRCITHTKTDDVMMNVFAGSLLLPFFAEPFRRYHLIHHRNTNTEDDPLWSPLKAGLFRKNRFLFVLCQTVPFLFTAVVLLSSESTRSKRNIKGPRIRFHYMLLSFLFSAAVLYFFHVSLYFYLGTVFVLAAIGATRHWCEHMGTRDDLESNTFWFPLGMGVGNHETHHRLPGISWLSLALGLRKREYDTNFFKTIYGVLNNKKFRHYETSFAASGLNNDYEKNTEK